MTDKELLELAAKAAGYDLRDGYYGVIVSTNISVADKWNPLTDDGDAFRLFVSLYMTVQVDDYVNVLTEMRGVSEAFNGDRYAATRRAIVRAAAEIGRSME